MKRTAPLVLALALCLGLLSGCQSSELRAYSDDIESEASNEVTQKDYTACFESYDPEELMMTINGIDVTWQELFYWYYYDVSSIEYYGEEISDWDDTSTFDGEQSYREYIQNNALEAVKHYSALEKKAEDMGIELSEENRAEIQSRWEENVASYGSGDEDAFVEYLESSYLSKDLYMHINEISELYNRMKEEIYGASGEKLSEQEVISRAEEMGYMRAKHIFVSGSDADGNALSEETKAAKKSELQLRLDELKAISGAQELERRMDELIAEHGEDPGSQYFPDGYTFREGEMVAEFEAAVTGSETEALYPEIVESSLGYHIVLRLPLSSSAAVNYRSETDALRLPYLVAEDLFASQVESWAEETEIEYSKAYEKMDIAKVFSKATTVKADKDN